MIRMFFIVLSAVALAVSCVDRAVDLECCDKERPDDIYPIRVEVNLPHAAADSKSSFTDEDLNRISDLNILVYHDGRYLEANSGYYTDMSSLMISFPWDKDDFNIYMVGNVGKVNAPDDEDDVKDLYYEVDSYEQFRAVGFPVANVFTGHKKGTQAVFGLKRLVGQYDIVLSPSAENAEYEVKDVRLMNCALDMYPFGENRKATVFTTAGEYGQSPGGDMLTEEDIAALNAGEKVSLYFVENLQGELLPDNTDRKKKIPSTLGQMEYGLADRCTYIEITSDIVTPGAEYTDGKYRFYLGQNQTTDFSICRNTLYEITLDFTQNMVSEEEWRIEVGAPEVKSIQLSKQTAHIVNGVQDYVIIQGQRVEIDEDNSCDNSDCCGYSLSDVTIDGVSCQKLTLMTNNPVKGLYQWGTDYETVASRYSVALRTVETYNGEPLQSKVVTVYVHEKLFPILVRMGTNNYAAPYQLEIIPDSPVYFDFDISASLMVDVGNTGTLSKHVTSSSVKGKTGEGYDCCYARFASLYNSGQSKAVFFKTMDLTLNGRVNDYCSRTSIFLDENGKVVYGPGYAPESYSANISGNNELKIVTTDSDGSLMYKVYDSDMAGYLFYIKPRQTKGFDNAVTMDYEGFNSGEFLPFYIVNGCHTYMAPYVIYNEEPPYVSGSGSVGVLLKSYVPGRDIFYPNGAQWGGDALSPGVQGHYGYVGAHKRQVFGMKSWTTYSNYECDFFMTINGCTAWPGASNGSGGFQL